MAFLALFACRANVTDRHRWPGGSVAAMGNVPTLPARLRRRADREFQRRRSALRGGGKAWPSNPEEHAARVVENSFVADRYTQVIGDLGEGHANYDRVKVETSRPDFIAWAEVALSDDAKTWRVVETRAPIARFRSRAVDGTQTIPFRGIEFALHSRAHRRSIRAIPGERNQRSE